MPRRPAAPPTGSGVPAAGEGERPLRADARRNREQVLSAAREVLVERGPDAPLDEIARRAGVGIGTLYRRFPDRESLLRSVVLDALVRTREIAEARYDDGGDPFEAVVAYMHAAIDLRVSAVIPMVLDRLDLQDAELGPAREASVAAIERLVEAAHRSGGLPEDVTFADIGLLLVRLSRPLPAVDPQRNAELTHRQLDLLVEGLRRPVADRTRELSGSALEREQLRTLRDAPQ